MDRYWFLTWTTYGSWLPGDDRGYHNAADQNSENHVGKLGPARMPNERLQRAAIATLSGPPIFLNHHKADEVYAQFHETCAIRGWRLAACGIMTTHCHVALSVPADIEPEVILRDLKSYASRRLNREFGKPRSETWWTESGSKRRLKSEQDVEATVEYIRRQPNPLLIWIRDDANVVWLPSEEPPRPASGRRQPPDQSPNPLKNSQGANAPR